MAVFRLYDCDIVLTIRDVNYQLDHVDSVALEVPERTRLTRGANAANSVGLVYKEGLKEATSITVPTMAIPIELMNLLKEVYRDRERFDFSVVARSDGSNKTAKNCILSQEPQQLTLDESPESLNVTLLLESFDVTEVHKS